jgi:hypothetical protein
MQKYVTQGPFVMFANQLHLMSPQMVASFVRLATMNTIPIIVLSFITFSFFSLIKQFLGAKLLGIYLPSKYLGYSAQFSDERA